MNMVAQLQLRTLDNLRQGMIAATGAITVPNERYVFYSGYKKIEVELSSTSKGVFITKLSWAPLTHCTKIQLISTQKVLSMQLMEYFWNTLLTTDKTTVFDLYLHGIYSYCIYRELEANLERSGVPVSIFLDQPSFHPCDASCAKNFARSYQCKHGMSFCKTSRSYTMSTRRLIVLGMHTWHLPMSMVVRVQSQTQQLPTCLRHNLIILIQDVLINVSNFSGIQIGRASCRERV